VTVVLLHALPLDERMWEGQREVLAGHSVSAPNLYALGRSMDAWARGVLAAVEGPLVVVGASMGGYAALAIAREAPERLRGVVLAGSRAVADPPDRRAARADTIRLIRTEGVEGLWADMRPKLFPEDAEPAVLERARTLALAQEPEALVGAVEAIRDRDDGTDVVRRLEAPLLVVIGTRDPYVPVAEAQDVADGAPNGRLAVFEGAGHLPSLDRPREFNRELAAFLEQLPEVQKTE
jgi:pimeloyl-ACP methyl ester carboxylesterase